MSTHREPSESEDSTERPRERGGWQSTFARWLKGNDDARLVQQDQRPSTPSPRSSSFSLFAPTGSTPPVDIQRGRRESLSSDSLFAPNALSASPTAIEPSVTERAENAPVIPGLASSATKGRSTSVGRSSRTSRPSSASSSAGGNASGHSLKNVLAHGAQSIKAHRDATQTFKSMRDNAGVEQRRTPSGSSVAACVESLDTAELLLRSAGVPQGGRLEGQGLAEQVAQGAACAAGPSASLLDLPHRVPKELQAGEPMLKVTSKKVMQRNFRLDADRGQILWDSKKQNKVNLESICEVRWASAAAAYRSSLSISPSHEPRWVSIIYQRSGEYKALHLIALSDESLARWKTGLEVLQSARCALLGLDTLGDGSGSQGKESVWLRQQWKDADSQTQDEKLDLNEIFKLCKRLGIQSSRADLQRRFQGADQQKKGYLDFAAFQHFVKLLKRRSELELLFNCYSQSHLVTCETGQTCQTKDTSHPMTREAFRRFLQDEQRVVLDEGQLDRLYDRHADLESSLLTLEGFSNFLLSADNSAIVDQSTTVMPDLKMTSPNKQRLSAKTTNELLASAYADVGPATELDTTRNSYQDMERPLYDYYISSSHNTYLVGGQWKGDSTVEGYVRALQQGARSVELDCWDGSNNTPQITHGRTLTGKVAFADVIAAIEKYAFAKSPYPLILSMEIHNDIAQQDVMAQILRETLKDKLLTERLATCKNPDGLPSPEELKGKVLIKAKNLIVAEAERARAEAAGESKAEAWHAPSEDYSASDDTTGSDDGLALNLRERASPFGSHFSSRHPEERQPRKVLMSTALASLLIYTVGVKSRGINKKEVYAPEHMISFSERTAFKYVRSAPDDLIKHNRSHLSRIYPSMSSIARLHQSANFLPHHLWAIGCQLVALNWQTADLGMELNQAMFIRNGRCGYVLKPEGLREKELVKSKGQRIRLAVDLDIISAQQLPRSRDATRDATKEKDKDEEADIISPSVSVTLLAPQSWGPQPATRTPATSRMSELVESVSMLRVMPDTSPRRVSTSLGTGHSRNPNSSSKEDAQIQPPGAKADNIALSVSELSDANSQPTLSVLGAATIASPPSLSPSPSATSAATPAATPAATSTARLQTDVVRNNGFNPIWNAKLSVPIEVPAETSHQSQSQSQGNSGSGSSAHLDLKQLTRGMLDLCFLRFQVHAHDADDLGRIEDASGSNPVAAAAHDGATAAAVTSPPLATSAATTHASQANANAPAIASYTACVGALQEGYRHLPLYDCHLTQHLFSTLFVRIRFRLVGVRGPEQEAQK